MQQPGTLSRVKIVAAAIGASAIGALAVGVALDWRGGNRSSRDPSNGNPSVAF